jgi:hypothetical protein
MMVSERYLRKKQRMIIKSGLNLFKVKAVIKTKNKKELFNAQFDFDELEEGFERG